MANVGVDPAVPATHCHLWTTSESVEDPKSLGLAKSEDATVLGEVHHSHAVAPLLLRDAPRRRQESVSPAKGNF